MFKIILMTVFVFWGSISVWAVKVGAPFEVASMAKETRNQTWASIAWAKDAKCWMVVWREGYLNENVSDIWCARISAEGKALDPSAVCLTSGVGVKDRPRIASDGKGFIVTWEDFRNGKDWDVYALRVSGAGSILDKEAVLIAGGLDNQCRPDVEFNKGRYCVLWMSFVDGSYGVYGTSFSPSEKPVVSNVEAVVVIKSKTDRQIKEGVLPVLSANKEGELLSACFVAAGRNGRRYISRNVIDPKTGGRVGDLRRSPSLSNNKVGVVPGKLGWYRERRAALALGSNEAVTVTSGDARQKSKKDLSFCRYSKTGELLSIQELGSSLTLDLGFKPQKPRPAVVFDGKSYLVISDCLSLVGTSTRYPEYRIHIIGWQVAPDGKELDANGFVVAGDDGLGCLLPALALGENGASLVVYSEVRGADDVKIIGRIIK